MTVTGTLLLVAATLAGAHGAYDVAEGGEVDG
eukprot:CAMPEP_0182543548 /NCGR_PEP_ID=MMETSP1323-20130603/31830_1 /TAXON_ID=236787 /ORGANISM="Florenciella parvula, Strain RCC1693" /LENGTH=31 /DNA_ID= /DNA_START= /DNA_END= /DNA_ORIENTATION=